MKIKNVKINAREIKARTIKAFVLLATFFIVGCNTSGFNQPLDQHQLSDSTILNLGNYSQVVADAISLTKSQLPKEDSGREALTTQLSSFSSDATLGHLVSLSASKVGGVLEIAADDGSYIKIDSNTGNSKTFITTVISGNLNVSFESDWSEHYSG